MASRGLIIFPGTATPCLSHSKVPHRHGRMWSGLQSSHVHLRKQLRMKTGIPATVAGVDQATDDGPDVENTAASPYTGKRVVVVGAGPSGTMAAMLLAEKGFDVQVFEKRPHPDSSSTINHRSIPLTLNTRVTAAIQRLGVTLTKGEFKDGITRGGPSAMMDKDGIKYEQISTKGDCLFGERHEIAFHLIRTAEAKGWENLKMIFDTPCKGVDVSSKKVELEGPSGPIKVSYDLLIGADGVGSVVREALQQQDVGFEVSKIPTGLRYVSFRNLPPLKDMPGDLESALKPGSLVFIRGIGSEFNDKPAPRAVIIYINAEGQYNGSVLGEEEGFKCVKGCELNWLNGNFGSLIPDTWREAIAKQLADGSISIIGPVTDSSSLVGSDIALVGDCCHTVTPTFGFGANLAISDSMALSEAMGAVNGDIAEGLKRYNEDWYPQVRSVMQLEKMNPRVQFKGGRTFGQKLWSKYFEFHSLFHIIGHYYLPWLVPQSVYRRFFRTELTAKQALRKFRQEGIVVATILSVCAILSLRFMFNLVMLLV